MKRRKEGDEKGWKAGREEMKRECKEWDEKENLGSENAAAFRKYLK